ncbi:MAG TPA: phosphotransferase, partial [Actinomycetes bacterium]|nr:phosphotransferase [Actinomycetes bacterium]
MSDGGWRARIRWVVVHPDREAVLVARRDGAVRLPEAERWLGETTAAIGRPLTGPVTQVRAWELSCILRAPTASGDVWFKTNAALPLFVNEGVVLTTLAELFGDRVAAPLAVDAERGWMVLDDHGEEVGRSASLELVEEVARSYARMQVEAAGQTDRLPAGGCHDRRLDRLAAQAEGWLPQVEATGGLPGIDDGTWLSAGELAAVRAALPQVLDCCAELAGFAVPPSIVHGDLHLDNVARGPGGYRFFDWTDACVAHPFLDLVTIRRGTSFAEEEAGSEAELRARLRAAYLPAWAAFEPPERLDRAYRLAAPLGALHQAVCYTSIVASQQPPIDVHMGQSTAWWLRRMLA